MTYNSLNLEITTGRQFLCAFAGQQCIRSDLWRRTTILQTH